MRYKRKTVVAIVICLLIAITPSFLHGWARLAVHLDTNFRHSFLTRFLHYKWEIGDPVRNDMIAELYFKDDVCYLDIAGSGNMMELNAQNGEGWYGNLLDMSTGWAVVPDYINIGEGVCSISSGAFAYFVPLSYVVLPSSINKIESRAFSGCSSLKELHFNGSIEQWEQIELDSDWNIHSAISKIICSDGEVSL